MLRGDADRARRLFAEPAALDDWAARWREQLAHQGSDPRQTASAMDRVNPVYIPRNHHVEDALAAATAGDLEPFRRLLGVLARPFDERPGLEAYAAPAPASCGPYVTYCGT
jgi:serine/tyrosine/threonine adenylyltransferase